MIAENFVPMNFLFEPIFWRPARSRRRTRISQSSTVLQTNWLPPSEKDPTQMSSREERRREGSLLLNPFRQKVKNGFSNMYLLLIEVKGTMNTFVKGLKRIIINRFHFNLYFRMYCCWRKWNYSSNILRQM